MTGTTLVRGAVYWVKRLCMRVLDIFALRGPNLWSRRPALEAWVALDDLAESSSAAIPRFVESLVAQLPSLVEHRCGVGERGGFVQRLYEGTWPGHIMEHLALELQSLAGVEVGFGKTRESTVPGTYRVVVRLVREGLGERLGVRALELACELVDRGFHGEPFEVAPALEELGGLVRAHEQVMARERAAEAGKPPPRAIPIVCVTGSEGKTAVCKLLGQICAEAGRTAAVGSSEGLSVGGELLDAADASQSGAFAAARRALAHPGTEVALFEVGARAILREGLGFDQCDVAVVTNIRENEHLGEHSVATLDAMRSVKRCGVDVVKGDGCAVLCADDPRVASMAEYSAGRVALFGTSEKSEPLRAHLAEGGRVAFAKEGVLVLAGGNGVQKYRPPSSWKGKKIESALAALLAADALGLDPSAIERGLCRT